MVMEKITINLDSLSFCLEQEKIDKKILSEKLKININTIDKALKKEKILTINQLKKIANYFNQGLLFFVGEEIPKKEKLYSIHFRTIENQKKDLKPKIKHLIQRIEKQRESYISLLEDLELPIITEWQKIKEKIKNKDKKEIYRIIRKEFSIQENDNFEGIRKKVTEKGILIFCSTGYNGKWQIEKNSSLRGFLICENQYPIITIKKVQSEGANAFTLMHELGHLFLHGGTIIDDQEDFFSYREKEKQANDFAASVLIPENSLGEIDIEELKSKKIDDYPSFFKKFKKKYCVSTEAILVGLINNKKLEKSYLEQYLEFQKDLLIKEPVEEQKIIPRTYRHREPIHLFGVHFVNTVLDALEQNHITLNKASSYLDNLKIESLKKLQENIYDS